MTEQNKTKKVMQGGWKVKEGKNRVQEMGQFLQPQSPGELQQLLPVPQQAIVSWGWTGEVLSWVLNLLFLPRSIRTDTIFLMYIENK